MPAAKGTRPPNAGKGRKKGSMNKLTRTVKEAFEHVFADLQNDKSAPHALENWAKVEPTEFYKLAAKLIPQDVKASVTGKVTMPELAVVAAALGMDKKG